MEVATDVKQLVPAQQQTVTTAKADVILNIILDETGSMQDIKEKTIEGLDEYLDSLRKDVATNYIVTLSLFSLLGGYVPNVREVCRLKPLKDVPRFKDSGYSPNGSTPLYDALGSTIRAVEKDVGDRAVLTIIITDGEENASSEWDKDAIVKLIQEKQALGNWTFVYLGADQDKWTAEQAAATMGMNPTNAQHYSKGATAQAFTSTAGATRSYSSGMTASLGPQMKHSNDFWGKSTGSGVPTPPKPPRRPAPPSAPKRKR